MITGLQHCGIYCKNIDESIRFYEKAFGFKKVCSADAMEGDLPLKLVFMRHPCGLALELLHKEDMGWTEAVMGSPNHICLRTDDAKGMYESLKDLDVTFECEPFVAPLKFDAPMDTGDKDVFLNSTAQGVTLQLFFLRGPSGERIEIMQDNLT